jgi:hypothetical protein
MGTIILQMVEEEDTDFEESFEGEEGEETVALPLSCTGWGISVFSLLLAYDILGQPRW